MKIKQNKKTGFTLIEILVVIGIIGILATVVLVAVNPNRQFKQARDSQRVANVNTILNALGQNIADHEGSLFCDGTARVLNDSINEVIMNGSGADIASCLIPDYISKLPYDPKSSNNTYYNNEDDYNTGYTLSVTSGRLTVSATGEIETNISVTR